MRVFPWPSRRVISRPDDSILKRHANHGREPAAHSSGGPRPRRQPVGGLAASWLLGRAPRTWGWNPVGETISAPAWPGRTLDGRRTSPTPILSRRERARPGGGSVYRADLPELPKAGAPGDHEDQPERQADCNITVNIAADDRRR